MAEINWNLLQPSNSYADALGGFQAGQQQRRGEEQDALRIQTLQSQQRTQAQELQLKQQKAQTEAEALAKTQALEKLDTLSSLAEQLKALPYETAKSRLKFLAPSLATMGITQQQLDGFDPTSENLDNFIQQGKLARNQLIGPEKVMAQANNERDFGQRQTEFAATDADRDAAREQQAREAAAGRAVTMRGQNMTDARVGMSDYRLMTPEEKKAAGLPTESAYQVSGNGQISRVAGNTSVRPIPASALAGIQSNKNTLRKIDQAIAILKSKTGQEALGAANYLGDPIRQRTNPEGVQARALVSDIGSQKLHDRSGAAITLSEAPRLQPFVPDVRDRSDVAITKLENLRSEYVANVDEAEAFYSPESGYMSVPSKESRSPPEKSTPSGVIRYDASGKRIP